MTSGIYKRKPELPSPLYYLAEIELKDKQEGIPCLTRRFCNLTKARAWVTERSSKPDCTGITAIYKIEPLEKGRILKNLLEN